MRWQFVAVCPNQVRFLVQLGKVYVDKVTVEENGVRNGKEAFANTSSGPRFYLQRHALSRAEWLQVHSQSLTCRHPMPCGDIILHVDLRTSFVGRKYS